jgi:hypothetical protein
MCAQDGGKASRDGRLVTHMASFSAVEASFANGHMRSTRRALHHLLAVEKRRTAWQLSPPTQALRFPLCGTSSGVGGV